MSQISLTGSSLTYTQDFNSLSNSATPTNTLPTGWEIFETGTGAAADQMYIGNDGSGNGGNTYSYGAPSSTERALGSLASGSVLANFGAKFTNNTGTTITSLNLTYKGEQWRLGNTALHTDTLYFMYSTNATGVSDVGATWTPVIALNLQSIVTSGAATGAIDGDINATVINSTINVSIANGSSLVIKWSDPNIIGSDDGLAIDSLTATFATGTPPPPSYRPIITALSPADNSTNVATTSNLAITFDRQVQKGTGNIYIINEATQATQMIDVTTTAVTVAGNVATITGITLAQSSLYHVMFDSTAFDTAGYKSYGIYDTVAWNFATVVPPPPPATSLTENFDASCGATPSNLPLGWVKYSVTGSQQWNCTSFGYNNTPAVSMNGFQSGNNVNEDWLITPQLDLNAMVNAYIQFRAFKKFAGNDLEVLVSNNYSGVGDPTVATWTNLNVNFAAVDTNWQKFEGNITPYKSQLMHVAFKYISTAADGSQWKLDDVTTTQFPLSIVNFSKASLKFSVLGNATTNEISLGYNLNAGKYQLSIFDVTGREVYKQDLNVQKGAQRATISGLNLTSGMYIIKLSNGNEFGVAKAIVQ